MNVPSVKPALLLLFYRFRELKLFDLAAWTHFDIRNQRMFVSIAFIVLFSSMASP